MIGKARSNVGRRDKGAEFSQARQEDWRIVPVEPAIETPNYLAKIADLQVDAARTALAEATVAARELSMATTPTQLILLWVAQLHHNAARILDWDDQFAQVGCALQAACNHALQSHAADWLHRFSELQPSISGKPRIASEI